VTTLPAIPVIDARHGGPLAAAQAAERQMQALLDNARRLIPPPLLAITDRAARKWLTRAQNPYLDEIDAIAALAGRSGAHTLNTSFEWCCTCGVGDDPEGGVRLLRVLDWGQSGLGRAVIVAWQQGPAGDFANITWPGFVGVIAAMAPGRFAVALNQAPMMSWGLSRPMDWLIGRLGVWRSQALPAAHLLRRVCETCASYEDAAEMLSQTPLCLPALFTLAGTKPGQGCVIERTPNAATRRELPTAVANHWANDWSNPGADHWVDPPRGDRPRGVASRERQALMEAALAGGASWTVPPIINRDTRLVAAINPARGCLTLQGWEKDGPVTAELALQNT
jgi:hypothetical protein